MVNNVPGMPNKALRWHAYDGETNTFKVPKPSELVALRRIALLNEAYTILNKRYDSQCFTAKHIFIDDFQRDAIISNLSAKVITMPRETQMVDRSQNSQDAKRRKTSDKGKGPLASVPESSSSSIDRNSPVNIPAGTAAASLKSPRERFVEEVFSVFYRHNSALHYFGVLKDENLVQNIKALAQKMAGIESGYIAVPVLIDNMYNSLYAVDIEGKTIHYCTSVISSGTSESERVVNEFFAEFAFTMEYSILTHSIKEYDALGEFRSLFGIESFWIISCMHAFTANALMKSQGFNIEPQISLNKDEIQRMQSQYLQWIKSSQ